MESFAEQHLGVVDHAATQEQQDHQDQDHDGDDVEKEMSLMKAVEMRALDASTNTRMSSSYHRDEQKIQPKEEEEEDEDEEDKVGSLSSPSSSEKEQVKDQKLIKEDIRMAFMPPERTKTAKDEKSCGRPREHNLEEDRDKEMLMSPMRPATTTATGKETSEAAAAAGTTTTLESPENPPPLLERQVDLQSYSSPGAFSVTPRTSSADELDDSLIEEETSSLGEDPASPEAAAAAAPSPPPPLDAQLVVPRARVSRPTEQQQGNNDVEQALPPAAVLEGVTPTNPTKDDKHSQLLLAVGIVCIFLLLVIIIVLVLGFVGVLSSNGGDESVDIFGGDGDINNHNTGIDLTEMTTLQRIKATGLLRCADVFLTYGFMYHDRRTGEKTGFFGELCQALAAALSVKAVFVPPALPWGYLQQIASHDQNETVDVTIIGHTITMERVVSGAMAGIQEGLSFTTPMIFEGLKVGGDNFHITHCVDKGMKHIGECDSIRVCVSNKTTHYDTIQEFMPTRFFVYRDSHGMEVFAGLKDGSCNVMVQGMFELSYPNAKKQGVTNYSLSQGFFSREPLAMVTKSNDPEFSDFVKSVLQSLLVAEQHNITQATADKFPQTDLFGPENKDMFRKAIRRVGNYGELYSKFLDEYIPRSSLNLLNNGTTGLMSSLPWGRLEKVKRGDRPFGSIMQSILDRGVLHCGIRTGRPGFVERIGASYHGMEIDLCMAVASGLFQGDTNAVKYVELNSSNQGFVKLATGDVDVLAGALWNIENDVKEPTSGLGFAFSQPYFYGYSVAEDNFALATRQDDHDWAAFVFWTVTGLINAEENGIHSNASNSMPEHFLFGDSLKRMFRDTVLVLGNYGDMYARHLEQHHPRSGRNMLNAVPDLGPQHYALPGFFD